MRAYSQSKLALVMFTFDLAEKLAGTGATADACTSLSYGHQDVIRDLR